LFANVNNKYNKEKGMIRLHKALDREADDTGTGLVQLYQFSHLKDVILVDISNILELITFLYLFISFYVALQLYSLYYVETTRVYAWVEGIAPRCQILVY
jgi:hypothetical protein